MSESDSEDKTEEPTAKRIEDARQKGQVPTSPEIRSFFVLLAGVIVVQNFLPDVFGFMVSDMKRFIALPHQVGADMTSLGDFIWHSMSSIMLALLIPFLLIMVMGIAGGVIQTGPLYAQDAMKMKWGKLNPMTGLKRMFSMNSLLELVKSIIKLVIIVAVCWKILVKTVTDSELYLGMPVSEILKLAGDLVGRVMGSVVATLALLGLLDFIHKRYEFMKNMRMSKEEVKEEGKQAEGDPKIKGRIRQLRMQKARQRMMAAVPRSDVVITNPTHYAVALEYKPEAMAAPVVVAKGMNLIAERIIEIAKENKVALVSNPPLARALHERGELDQPIPVEQYQAVAEVISFVFKLRQKRGGQK